MESNIIYISLAGTGKTEKLTNIAKRAIKNNENILVLVYNTDNRHNLINDNDEFHPTVIHTLHSFCFNELRKSGILKQILMQLPKEESVKYFSESSKVDYDKITIEDINNRRDFFDNLLDWFLENIKSFRLDCYDYIIVDEVQDLSEKMITIIEQIYLLNKPHNVKIIAAGDPKQSIYHFMKKTKKINIYENFKFFIDKLSCKVKRLTKSFRCSPSIQRFANAFYRKHYSDNIFYDLSGYSESDYKDDVKIW